MANEQIVDYVEIVEIEDGQFAGQFKVRARSNNGDIIWWTEQYGDRNWALAVALDSGKPLKTKE